jgi:hypothetical protein
MTTGRWLLPAHRSRCVRLLAAAASTSSAATSAIQAHATNNSTNTRSCIGTFDAAGLLHVGAVRRTPPGGGTLSVDSWHGDIDDVGLCQPALNAVAVKQLFADEATTATEIVG